MEPPEVKKLMNDNAKTTNFTIKCLRAFAYVSLEKQIKIKI